MICYVRLCYVRLEEANPRSKPNENNPNILNHFLGYDGALSPVNSSSILEIFA